MTSVFKSSGILTITAIAISLLLSATIPALAQTVKISGKVVDETGLPMIGAGVICSDGKTGTVTDMDGKYTIFVQPGEKILRFSSLSYATKEVLIDGRTTIDVTLEPDSAIALNEVVVIGYGTTKKQDLTGSVATVKMEDIAEDPAISVDQALQGRIAGVDIMSTSGDPSSSTSIRIRGTRSINASNEPLIIVDGVIDAVNDISEVNPTDIESISIMKDASSTAIYGSRGANGVVLITTKKGTTDKPSVKVSAKFGVAKIARKLDLMNSSEFIRYRNDLGYFRSGTTTSYLYDIDNYNNNTDWVDAVTRIAPYQDYSISISGTVAKKLNYFASLSYNDKQGIIKASGQRRITGKLNLTYDVNKYLTLAYKGSYTFRDQQANRASVGGKNIYTSAIYLAPIMGADDSVNPLYENGTNINGPLALIELTENEREYLTNTNVVSFIVHPIKGMTIKSQNSYMVYQRHDYEFYSSKLPAKKESQGADAYRYEGDARKFTTENTITYKRKIGGHTVDGLLGFSAATKNENYISVNASGLLSDDLKWNNLNGVTSKENYTCRSSSSKVVNESIFARANYNYKSRYYLTGTVRWDGSSNFAANQKWGFFPSGAFKWSIKNEPWMKSVRAVNDLSLRISAGLTGNDAIPAYRSLQAYSTSTGEWVFNGSRGADVYPSRVANPNLTWETTKLYNVALDASFFKDRLGVSLEVYKSTTTNLLLSVQTINTTGYPSRLTNLGQTSNKGVELTLDGKIIEKKKFGWTSELTISYNSQMVDNIGNEDYVATVMSPGNTSFMMYGYKKGYPLNALWGFEYAGVWHSVEEFERNNYTKEYISNNTVTSASENLGWPKYVDQNNDGALTMDDLIYLGSSDPVLYGGFQNTFHWGGLKLGIFFSYSLGGKIYNYSELIMAGSYATNQYRYMLNAWHPLRNPDSNLPRAGTDDYLAPSTFAVHDASYIRLKNVNLSYTFDLTKHSRSSHPFIKGITVGVSASNLFLWTKYNGFDPDVSSTDADGETSISRRLDIGAYPRSREFIGNLLLKF